MTYFATGLYVVGAAFCGAAIHFEHKRLAPVSWVVALGWPVFALLFVFLYLSGLLDERSET